MRAGTDFQTFYSQLDEKSRARIDNVSKKEWAQADTLLITQDTPSDTVYIIESGVVEVLVETPDSKRGAPLTYLGPGDILGELGILNHEMRSASIRTVVDVYYREIHEKDFLDLLTHLPGFGLYIAQRLAERLANRTSNLAYNSCCVDLSGKIPPFDLAAIFCTIEGSNATGELKILDLERNVLGSFFIENAVMRHARYLHLQGQEAFWQLFLEDTLEVAFSFRRCSSPSRPGDEDMIMNKALSDLLVEAAIMRDHYRKVPEELRNLAASVSRKDTTLVWEDADTLAEARQVWDILSPEPLTLQMLWSRSNLSTFSLGIILQHLSDGGQTFMVKRKS